MSFSVKSHAWNVEENRIKHLMSDTVFDGRFHFDQRYDEKWSIIDIENTF